VSVEEKASPKLIIEGKAYELTSRSFMPSVVQALTIASCRRLRFFGSSDV
jgi:hypothetical protein